MAAISPAQIPPRHAAALGATILVAALTIAVLVLTAYDQIYDTNFYTLWESTALLAGDHPYRDFYEWGVPMQAVFSAGGQVLSGHRLLGEFLLQWLGIVCGAVISFRLGLRLSGSIAASMATACVPVILAAGSPIYHYPKLFFYPFAVWLAWRYMERPGVALSGALGLTAGMAFLFRHDHGIYIGGLSLLAFVLGGLAAPSPRGARGMLVHAATYAAAVLVLLLPWLVFVQTSEGLAEYVEQRLALQTRLVGTAAYWPYRSLLDGGPTRLLVRSTLDGQLLSTDDAVRWLMQLSLVVPLVALLLAGLETWHARRRGVAVPREVYPLVLLGGFLAGIDNRLFREPSYMLVVAPLTAALAARLLVRAGPQTSVGATQLLSFDRAARTLGWGVVGILFIGAGLSAAAFSHRTGILAPGTVLGTVDPTIRKLLASPPIDGLLPADVLRQYTPTNWGDFGSGDKVRLRIRYMHDCSRSGDRVLVMGSTPFDISYYVERPIAGGHLFWHQRWRDHRTREEHALNQLRQQAVPFVYSTTDPVFDDLTAYPRILAHVKAHYVEPAGAEGRLLVDARLTPTGAFSPMGWPCFR